MNTYYDHIRKDIFDFVPQNINSLLDIGCGYGSTSSSLKIIKNIRYVAGVEKENSIVQKCSKQLDEVFQLDLNKIEKISMQIKQRFDCILMLDVLEHLINPYDVLKDMINLLNNNGIIIISLPNIRHYTILYDLIIKNQWEYKEEGILDKTHLRFFTLKSMSKMIESSGLKVMDYKSNKQFKKMFRYINCLFFNQLSKFADFQYIFKCTKGDD